MKLPFGSTAMSASGWVVADASSVWGEPQDPPAGRKAALTLNGLVFSTQIATWLPAGSAASFRFEMPADADSVAKSVQPEASADAGATRASASAQHTRTSRVRWAIRCF